MSLILQHELPHATVTNTTPSPWDLHDSISQVISPEPCILKHHVNRCQVPQIPVCTKES